jgi:hypothetical protein
VIKKGMADDDLLEAADEKELGLVTDIIRTVTKTMKTFHVYPKDNPIYHKFAAELFDRFTAFFDLHEELPLDIQQFSLLYKGAVVLHSEEKTDNIALLLFADGLRQLSFQKGITAAEVTDFIEILRSGLRSKATADDDVVTLLWEKDIRNMAYVAVEDTVEDDMVVEEGLLTARLDTAEEEITAAVHGAQADWKAASLPGAPDVGPLSDSDREQVVEEAQALGETSLLSSAMDLFAEMLSLRQDSAAFPEIAVSIGRIIDLDLERKDVGAVLEVLKTLRRIGTAASAPELAGVVETALAAAGTPENLRAVFAESENIDETRQYLTLLGGSAVPAMIALLGELSDRRHRKLLCDVLVEAGRSQIDTIASYLDDKRWYVVRNIAMVLGLMKEPAAVRHIAKVIGHYDTRVRREAVRALDAIRSADAKELYVRSLNDPDLTVRTISLRAVRRSGDASLFETVAAGAARDELKNKTYAEKKEWLETLAVLGGEKAFPILSDLFKKRWLLEKDDSTELRAAAASGLGIVGTEEAAALLEKEAGSKKPLLRDACVNALKETRKDGTARK